MAYSDREQYYTKGFAMIVKVGPGLGKVHKWLGKPLGQVPVPDPDLFPFLVRCERFCVILYKPFFPAPIKLCLN